ncbi:hypothetical protein J1614_002663 [Plenodomus biglobosus]|nr:hypothetical protein J1614_002663 [Plenodomus biglobosus]
MTEEMQKAVGHTNAPHPEVEAELQQELAKIECKIEQGTVTKAEADHLHSLEARAHGHTEKGSITSIAQSVAAKRQRQLSLGAGISPAGSQGLPGLSQEQASRGDGSDARKKTPSVLGDRSNGSCQPSGGNELDAKVADMGPESKSKEKDENVNKKESDRKCCHDDGVDKESHIAAILAKPHAREESQHVFGP